MNLPALILALVAGVLFVLAYLAVPRKWANANLALACLTAAWICQLVFVGFHQYAFH